MDLVRPDDDEGVVAGDNVARSKFELEIESHVLSATVKLSDGTEGPVFTRIPRNKDLLFGYSCHICGVVCLHGERMLQIHMAGRKHQARLNVAVFDAEQYRAALVMKPDKKGPTASADNASSGDSPAAAIGAVAAGVPAASSPTVDQTGNDGPTVKPVARLQGVLDGYRDGPLVGLEYIVEQSEGSSGNDPVYSCTLCTIDNCNEGDITTHLISLQHRLKFLQKHYPTVRNVLAPYRQSKTDRGAQVFCRVVQTVCEAIEDHHGRLTPQVFNRDDFERNRVKCVQQIAFGSHFDERTGKKFVEVIDHKVLEDLAGAEDRSGQNDPPEQEKGHAEKRQGQGQGGSGGGQTKRYRNRNERGSLDSISSLSSANSVMSISSSGDNKEPDRPMARKRSPLNGSRPTVDERHTISANRVDYRRGEANLDRYRASVASCIDTSRSTPILPTPRELALQSAAIAHERYKWEKYRCSLELAEGQLVKKLKEYEKNPEKHPLYSDEWKNFWNRRYKELQQEKKDPQKHNFKPEWIEFWTKRMVQLHDEEVARKKLELRTKMQLPAEGEERTDELREQFTVRVPAAATAGKRQRSIERKNNDAPPVATVLIDVNSDEEEDDYKGGQPGSGRSKMRASARRAEWERSRRRSDSRSHRSRSPISDDAMEDYSRKSSSSRSYVPPMERERPSKMDMRAAEQVDYDAWAKNYYGPNKKVFVRTEFDTDNVPLNFIAVCRLLTAFEEYLGSLGPKVIDLMAKALALEKVKPNSADDLLLNEDNCMFLETVKEKLKGHMMAETIDPPKMAPIKKAVRNIARLLHEVSKREPAANLPAEEEVSRDSLSLNEANPNPPVAPAAPSGGAGIDKIAIAEQLAKALVAQGKVDFTTEELEQLINVYIAMEKMSRERQTTVSTKAYLASLSSAGVAGPSPAVGAAGGAAAAAAPVAAVASATNEKKDLHPKGLDRARLENPRRVEKNDFQLGVGGSHVKSRGDLANSAGLAPASGGGMLENLDDSDLQTLLQSFKELSSEEQMHLISYLRKLERTEPDRVDMLRRYVDFDALYGPSGRNPEPPGMSDDDDNDDEDDRRRGGYDDMDDDNDFETFRGASSASASLSNVARNQQPMKASINNQQLFNHHQPHTQQQQQKQHPLQQQQQHQQKQQKLQQQMGNRQKELQQQQLQQHQKQQQSQSMGSKLFVDSEDEDDYSYDDILRAASKNVSNVTHPPKSSVDTHDASSNQSHRGNGSEAAGGGAGPVSLSDTQNLIANLMESLQKSVSDATTNPAASGSRGTAKSGTDYTNPITTIGVGRAGGGAGGSSGAGSGVGGAGGAAGGDPSLSLVARSSGASQFYPAQTGQMGQLRPQQGPQGSSNQLMQQLGPYAAPQGPPLGQQLTAMVQSQGGGSMGQMQQQQNSFGQQFMYQGQMYGANGQQQTQQQYGYGNFGYY